MGNVNDNNNKLSKQAADWVNKNMTNNTSEILANNLSKGINKVFCAPFDIAMGLIDIIQNKKYSRFIVGVWSVIGASVLLGSLILYVLNNNYPFGAWGLGVCLASLVVIWIAKHPVRFDVSSDLSTLIEDELNQLNSVTTASSINISESISSILNEEDDLLIDDGDELLSDDDELLSDDEDDGTFDEIDNSSKESDKIIDSDMSNMDIRQIVNNISNNLSDEDFDDDDEIDLDDVEVDNIIQELSKNYNSLESNNGMLPDIKSFYENESSISPEMRDELDRYLSDDKNATY